ncbi:uncharacterized protein LOC134189791 [Corticium candelabrum]|uniref:uncharacterized protein LOC134189791 n=1 Tax=Corticium candelabrum TaxID=121492 RepID=UPI002E26F13E|nr:uncharacterized protein LOC134189791 [Corticium candelabrum]
MLLFSLLFTIFGVATSTNPPYQNYTITLARNATPQEAYAARDLAKWLNNMTNIAFTITSPQDAIKRNVPQLAVGPDAALAIGAASEQQLINMSEDEVLITSQRAPNVAMTGGRGKKRGTLYAVVRFLHHIGYRWYAPDEIFVPDFDKSRPVPSVDESYRPVLNQRDHDEHTTQGDPEWWIHNYLNGYSCSDCPNESQGGHFEYVPGYSVHTYYKLVPPDKYFRVHPEWYSLISGVRTFQFDGHLAQLCLTNESLLAFVVDQVKSLLKANPTANLISVTQNDVNGGNCECDRCKAVEAANGGAHSGPTLRFANLVADAIKDEFPNVTVTQLAYQYTRAPPTHEVPHSNVAVRLCSIECDFARPLSDPNNAAFQKDILGWSKIATRLHIWNYVTDFGNFIQPFPDWHVLGPNIRFLSAHSAKAIYEEGNYQSKGGEMQEMRAWVMAQMMWDPSQNDSLLIQEFIHSYYSDQAGLLILKYMDIIERSVHDTSAYVTEHDPPTAKFLTANAVLQSLHVLASAVSVAMNTPLRPYKTRVMNAMQPVLYVTLLRWNEICQYHRHNDTQPWPLPRSISDAYNQFARVFNDIGGTRLSESGHDLKWLQSQLNMTATCDP